MKPRNSLILLVLFAVAFLGGLRAFREVSPIAPVRVTVRAIDRSFADLGELPPPPVIAPAPASELASALVRDEEEQPDEREALRLASADEDSDVAARAQEAYEALVDRDDDAAEGSPQSPGG